jgi:hypothetical protein
MYRFGKKRLGCTTLFWTCSRSQIHHFPGDFVINRTELLFRYRTISLRASNGCHQRIGWIPWDSPRLRRRSPFNDFRCSATPQTGDLERATAAYSRNGRVLRSPDYGLDWPIEKSPIKGKTIPLGKSALRVNRGRGPHWLLAIGYSQDEIGYRLFSG